MCIRNTNVKTSLVTFKGYKGNQLILNAGKLRKIIKYLSYLFYTNYI